MASCFVEKRLESQLKGRLTEKSMGLTLADLKVRLLGNLGLEAWKE